jgi:hypothetical protein
VGLGPDDLAADVGLEAVHHRKGGQERRHADGDPGYADERRQRGEDALALGLEVAARDEELEHRAIRA